MTLPACLTFLWQIKRGNDIIEKAANHIEIYLRGSRRMNTLYSGSGRIMDRKKALLTYLSGTLGQIFMI